MILRQRLKPRVTLDLTPLIDVVFQLVVFFMISSVFNTAPGIELELPELISFSNLNSFVSFPLTGKGRDSVTNMRLDSTGSGFCSPSENFSDLATTLYVTAPIPSGMVSFHEIKLFP